MMPQDFPPRPPMPPGHQMMSNNFPPPPPNMPPPGQPMPPSNLPPNMMNNMHNMSHMMPPNPSNPMQQGFVPNQPFMQQQQQQQLSIPFGPTQPPIFTGHIENHSTKKEIYLQELFFQQYIKIEGIHIVPEMITPPGFMFTGKTFPRQFELEIFGKVQNSSEWMKLFNSPIYGGVQWLPILETEEEKIFEDIVIKGDFEILSLIIHGTIIEEDSILPSPSLPLPAYLYEYQLDTKEINILQQSELFLSSNSDVLKDHEALETIFGNITLLQHKNSLKSMFSSIHPEDFTIFSRNFVSLIYPYSSSSLVSLSIASNLIEKIFSLDSDPTQQPTNYEEYQQLIQQIHELIHEFQFCYEKQSYTSVQNMGKLMEVIGDEGAQLVANYTIKQLKNFLEQTWLHSQTTKQPTEQSTEQSTHQPETSSSPIFDTIEKKTQFYLQYGESILTLCHILLKNDLLAEEFISFQGMYYLNQLTFHIQTLPISLSTLLIICYSDAFVYSTAVKGFITMDEEIHTSPYQSMLYYVASIKSNSPSMIPCQWLFNLYAWYDDLTHLSSLVDVSIPILHDIVEGINSKLASCEKIPLTVNEYDQDMEHNHQNTSNDEDILHIPSQVLEEVFQNLFQITHQIELSWNNMLQSYELFSSHSTSITSSMYQLSYIQYMTLKNTHFLSSLIALLSIRMITLELQTLLDWKAPNQMKIHAFLQQLDHTLSLFFMKLFSISHWELLVIDQPKILDIYWNTISTTSIGSIGALSSKLSQYLLFDVRNLHIFPQYITTLNQSQPIDTYDPLFVTFTMIHYILQQIETFFQAISFDPVLVTSNTPESLKTIDEITTQIRQTGSSLLSLLQHPILRSMVQIFLIKYYLVDLIQHILQITKYLDNDSIVNASSDIQSKLYQVAIKNLSTILHSCLLSPDATVLSIVHVHSQVLQEVIEHLSMIKKSSKTLSTVVKDISDILSSTALSTLISLPLQQQQQNQGNSLFCLDTYDSRQDEILLYPEWIETFQQFSLETFKSKEKLTKFNQRMNILSSYMITLSSASIELIYTHAYSIFQCAYETLLQLLVKCFLPNSEANVYLQYKLQKIASFSSSTSSNSTLLTINPTLLQEMKGFIEQQYTLKDFVPVIENIFTLLNTMFHCFSSPNSPIPMTKLSYEPILIEYFQLFMNIYSFAASPWLQSISKFTSFHIQQIRLYIQQIFQQFVLTTASNTTSSTLTTTLPMVEEKNEEQFLIFHLFETILTRINDHYLFEKEILLQLLFDILFPTLIQSETMKDTTLSCFVSFLHQNNTMLTMFVNIIQHSILHESIEFNEKIISLVLLMTKYCMTNTSESSESTPELPALLLSIYDLLINLLDNQSKEYLQTTITTATSSTTSTTSLEQEKTFQEQKLLKLLFIFSKFITSSPIATYFFVHHGIIELLFPFFQVDLTILLPSFQLILLIRTQLLYLLETIKEENDILISNYSLKLTIDSMTAHLIDNIPRLPKKFPDSGILLAQSIIAIHGLSDASYWNKYLQTVSLVGEGFTLEFIAIKLWIYFEDSYQYLSEINDIRKQYALTMTSSTSTSSTTSFQPQDITSLLLEAQRQYHLATYALKCILDIAMWSYEAQKIPLSSLAKTMRSSLTDPRKLIIRIRGQYNIWFSSLSPELIIPTEIKYLSLSANNSNSSSEGDQRNMFFTSEQLELFDSRHAGISYYLRYLVELTSKYARYQSAKEERYKNFLPCQEIPMEQWTIALTQCNFNKPFDQIPENSLNASSLYSSNSYLLIKTWAKQHVSQLITSWIPNKQNLFFSDILSHCFYSQWSNEPSITRPMMFSSIILQNVDDTPIFTYKKQRVMDITTEPLPKTPVGQEKRSLPPPPPPPSFTNSDDSRFKNPPPIRREEEFRFPPNEQYDNNNSNQGFNDTYRESPSKYNRRPRGGPSDRGIHGLPKTAFQSNSYSDSHMYSDDNSLNYNQNNNTNPYVPNGNSNEYFDEFSNSSFSNPPSGPPRGFQNGPLPPNPPFFPPRGPPPPSGFARPPPPMPPQFRPQQ